MIFSKETNGNTMTVSLSGRLDSAQAPSFESFISGELGDTTDLIIDLAELDYISSAGLRVLLSTQKIMSKKGTMTVKNPNDMVTEVFEITGFCDILTIE